MPKTVVFDLDGTLADTSGDLIAAANATLSELGYGPQLRHGPDDAVAVRGGRRMLALAFQRLGLPERQAAGQIDAGYPLLLAAYDGAIDVHTTLYPGAMAAVAALRDSGHRTAICTNKPEGLAQKLLVSLGVRDQFDALVGADTLPVRKPDPAPLRLAIERTGGQVASSLLVGDSDTDRNTARAANVPCILVGFGPEGRAPMAKLQPEAIIDHFNQLSATVARLLPD